MARKDAEKMIKSKRKKGYTDAERAISIGGVGTQYTEEMLSDELRSRWDSLCRPNGLGAEYFDECGEMIILEVEGDLHIPGHLNMCDLNLAGLIVHGDLIVDGCFQDYDDPMTFTVVKGNMIANSVLTAGELEVHGNLTCENLIGDYNHYGCFVGGDTNAEVFFEENHHFEFVGSKSFRFAPTQNPRMTFGEVSDTFVKAVLDHPLDGSEDEVERLEIRAEDYFDMDHNAFKAAAKSCRSLLLEFV